MNKIIKITEINNYSDFLSLEKEWDVLHEKSNQTIFSHWIWLSTWWKYFGDDKQLIILLAHDDGQLIGIAPLMQYTKKIFGFNRNKIAIIGTPHSDYNSFIISHQIQDCINSLILYLNKNHKKWSCMELTDLQNDAQYTPILKSFSKQTGPLTKCTYKLIPKSYGAFLSGLSGNLRRSIEKNSKLIKEDFEVEFLDCSSPQECEVGMNALFDLHQKRWVSKGLPGVLKDSTVKNFHLDVAKSFALKNKLGLYLLRLSGNPVAALYGFKYQNKFYDYLSGMHPEYSSYGVGNLLRAHVIKDCMLTGLSEIDFLRGDEAYKNRWKVISKFNTRVIIPRKGFFSNACFWFSNKILGS